MCGYQGWFTCPGDGTQKGWCHWGNTVKGNYTFEPGACSIDLWPDMSEFDEDEKYNTDFMYPDGTMASVFSSVEPKTVDRHFKWMKEYGIDGVFVQRFAGETRSERNLYHVNTVLKNCRKSANVHGRAYAVMYDLSGLPKGGTKHIISDWKDLVDDMKITRDPADTAYQLHRGKPVISLWGIGFNDRRQYTLQECMELIEFFKNDPQYGGMTVMVGVPTYWRSMKNDSVNDPVFHELLETADVISPWMVGRVRTIDDVSGIAENVWKPDLLWCNERQKDYYPVVYPGFSWANLQHDSKKLNEIPRLKGRFLWAQYYWAKKVGVRMIYQAMFDEVDEGTAIFKCTNTPPAGGSPFLTYEGLPSDHYLWLVGQGGRMLRGEIPVSESIPERQVQ